jgi:hypothetical protein
VGRKQFNSGDVWVLGGKPGSKGSGVPGPRIGYMPQVCANIESNVTHLVVKGLVGGCGGITIVHQYSVHMYKILD